MTKTNILLGFILSILATIAGTYIYMEYIMQDGFEASWKWMIETHNASSVIPLGAIPNLLLFYVFIKRREDAKAKGVLFGVILTAIVVFLLEFL